MASLGTLSAGLGHDMGNLLVPVRVRLESLLNARIKEYVDMNPRDLAVFGLQPPRMRFTVYSKDKTRTEGLDTGRSEANQVTSVYAKRRGDSGVFTMELSSELVILPDFPI